MYREDSNKILDRMLSNSNTSKIEGTYILDALSPVSKELSKSKTELEEVLLKSFAQSAFKNKYSKELEMRAYEFGVERKQGKKATGTITIIGNNGTKIKKGFIVQTVTGLRYLTTEDVEIQENEIEINIIAESVGSDYNVDPNKIVQAPIQLVGIISIINKEKINGGYDIETDKQLYERLLLKVRTPATSGNKYHYMLWAMEVEGVGDARVFPLWNGNGSVKIVIASTDKKAPTKEVLDNVIKHVEEVRPIGATVTVKPIEEVKINISLDIQKGETTPVEEIKQNIKEKVGNYLKDIALKENVVRIARIANCILDVKGVIDYANLKINNNTVNVELTEEQVAVVGEVVLNNVN